MRCRKIKDWVDGNDAMGVNHIVAIVIVAHDMVKMHRFRDLGDLIQFARVRPDIGVISDPLTIAFKVQMIDQVKADQRRKQPPISLCQC